MQPTNTKATILIVEDNSINLKVLDNIVSSEYNTILSKDGKDAIEKAKSNKIDLILLDIMLPELDGYTVCKVLKNDNTCKDIPVIFVTALTSHEDELKGLESGGVDFITKPFSAPIVMARIKTHIKYQALTQELCKLATIDSLTAIANRRAFDENIKLEWKRSMLELSQLSVMMIDIDYFKIYNDTYGHQGGDKCIQNIANILKNSISEEYLLARYGGEEFVILMPNCDEYSAMQTAVNIKDVVYNSNLEFDNSKVSDRVSVSIGISTCTPSNSVSYNTLINKADEALYISKDSGRDRISVKN
jgi:diguanylate cyclase (GGDEF)-like protein